MANKRFFDGAQIEIGALPVVGSSASNGSASGLFSTVTVSAANATLTISSTAMAGLVTVAVISPSASAFVGGGGNYPFVIVSVDNPTGSVSGTASTSGNGGTVTVFNQSGTASGAAQATGLSSTVAAVEPTFTATCSVTVSATISGSVNLGSLADSSIGETSLAGSIDDQAAAVRVQPFAGSAGITFTQASGMFATTQITSCAGFAIGINIPGKAISWTAKTTWARSRVLRLSRARSNLKPVG